jgi:sulfate/thiosulfate transport system permease protein
MHTTSFAPAGEPFDGPAMLPSTMARPARHRRAPRVLPGFRLSLGFTLCYLTALVLIPLGGVVVKATGMGWERFWAAISSPRAIASYQLTFGAAFAAALVNTVCGLLVAWVLVRYPSRLTRLLDGLVDVPFAMPTAVAGIALTALYAPNGWIGSLLAPFDIKIAFTPIGVAIAMVFVGLPFVVRTVQPVLRDIETEVEEAAASLGATRGQTFRRVIAPAITPALVTGFSLAFARGLGEYGSVVFISGNMPFKTEITTLLIVTKLEQYDYAGATALAAVMLAVSFALLLVINAVQGVARRRGAAA